MLRHFFSGKKRGKRPFSVLCERALNGIISKMKDYLKTLNDAQRKAVLTTANYVRIIAGAGSGKTRVLTSRIVHLIEEIGADPKTIVAITFTNKAANVMKERIANMLEEKGAGVHVSTIHSLCVTILRRDIVAMDYPRNFTVLDADDQKSILKEAYREFGLDKSKFSYAGMLDYISNNKSAHIDPDKAYILAGTDPNEKDKARVYDFYVNREHKLYALDFDDLLLMTVDMFEKFPEILRKWQRIFHYIHVDEFQDIDKVQYRLITLLAGSENDVYVVGDPDQTIYTWRGADINIIMNFERDFPSAETIFLKQNYRSDAPILNGANCLIKNNRNRLDKDLFTSRDGGEKITHYKGVNEEYEALWVASKIEEGYKQNKPLTDYAVLYRANYLSRSIEKSLVDAHIPYVIYGGIRFYDRAEIKDALSYLRMVITQDDLSFKRIINTPKRKIGQKTIDTIYDRSRELDCTMYEVLQREKLFKGTTQQTLENFVAMVERWREKKDDPISNQLERILDESGYRFMLETDNETERLENLKELISDVSEFQKTYPDSSLEEYLQMVNLYGDRSDFTDGNYVQLMTVHAAKGLEFDTVFVIGLSEGIFPSERTLNEGVKGLEEERRLAYVAYTRAMHKLYLTESGGYSYQTGRPKSTSRFVKEIDDEYIEHIGANFEYRKPVEMPLEDLEERYTRRGELPERPLQKQPNASRMKKGDLVEHTVYGSGVVLNINDNIMEIAFSHPYGIRKIMAGHPSVTKK